ncbi:MAG TPA: insulinase family protein, partial [Myxococcota bacterium]
KAAALVLVGDLSLDDAKALAEKQLGKWRGGPAKPPKAPAAPKAKKATKILVVDFPGAPQTIIRLARPLLAANDPEQPQVIVMNQVLGGMFTSRLNLKLREEKQWSYGAFSYVDGRLGPGPFLIGTDVQTDKTGDALVEIFAQLDTLKTGGITAEELALAQANYTRSLPGLFALPPLQASVAGSLFALGLPMDHYATLSTAVTAVTAEGAKAAAERAIVKDDFVVVLVGDRAKIEEGLKDKNLGEVVVVGKDGVVAK